MDRNMIYAGVSVALAGLLGFTWAQGRGALHADEPKSVAGEIAVVDMSKIFNAHKGLLARMEEVNRDGQRAKEEAKAIYDAARQLRTSSRCTSPVQPSTTGFRRRSWRRARK